MAPKPVGIPATSYQAPQRTRAGWVLPVVITVGILVLACAALTLLGYLAPSRQIATQHTTVSGRLISFSAPVSSNFNYVPNAASTAGMEAEGWSATDDKLNVTVDRSIGTTADSDLAKFADNYLAADLDGATSVSRASVSYLGSPALKIQADYGGGTKALRWTEYLFQKSQRWYVVAAACPVDCCNQGGASEVSSLLASVVLK